MGLPPARRFPAGGGFGSEGDLNLQMPEYGRAVQCNATYSWPLFGGGVEDGLARPQSVMGTGGDVFCGLAGVGGVRRGRGMG